MPAYVDALVFIYFKTRPTCLQHRELRIYAHFTPSIMNYAWIRFDQMNRSFLSFSEYSCYLKKSACSFLDNDIINLLS